MECEFVGIYGGGDAAAVVQLKEENDQLREELRRTRLECQRLQENNRRQETHISILTSACEQLVEELESSGEQHVHKARRESNVILLTPPSSGRSSCSNLPDSDDHDTCCSAVMSSTCTETQEHRESPLPCPRCQLLAEELAQTRQELESVDRQLQCAAKQKFMLQEKLCHYEEDIGILIQKGISHKLP